MRIPLCLTWQNLSQPSWAKPILTLLYNFMGHASGFSSGRHHEVTTRNWWSSGLVTLSQFCYVYYQGSSWKSVFLVKNIHSQFSLAVSTVSFNHRTKHRNPSCCISVVLKAMHEAKLRALQRHHVLSKNPCKRTWNLVGGIEREQYSPPKRSHWFGKQ